MHKFAWPREGQDPFAEFLSRQRKSLGLTLQQLAEDVGVSAAFLSYVETGAKVPKSETGQKLARALEIPPYVVEAWIRVKRSDDVEHVRVASDELHRFLQSERQLLARHERSIATTEDRKRKGVPDRSRGASVLFQRAYPQPADLENRAILLPVMTPEHALVAIRGGSLHTHETMWVDRQHFSRGGDTSAWIAIRPRGAHSGRTNAPDDPGQIFVVDSGPARWQERARFVVWTDARLRVMLAVGRGKDRLMISQADPADSYLVHENDLRADGTAQVIGELLLVISEIRRW